jgi:hypothetical protein
MQFVSRRHFMKRVLTLVLVAGVAFSLGHFLQARLSHADAVGGGAGTPSGNGDVNGDAALNLTDAIHLLQHLFQGGPAPVPIKGPPPGQCAVAATGQTQCYDAQGGEIDCASAEFYGQDGLYQEGCPREGRFVESDGETVTDTCTGLVWQKNAPPESYSWQDALQYCESLTLGGHGEWRLPNVRELQSIADYGRVRPSTDPIFQGATVNFWSSSTNAGNSDQAWSVNFSVGSVIPDSKSFSWYVRAVSSGE